ncbi:MAG: isoaspartyl peptidase/L-asparaginase [Candidatus Electrothrix sp. YB6]
MNKPCIIIHCGAGKWEGAHCDAKQYRQKLKRIVKRSFAVLAKDGARDACLYAVAAMENDPLFNAGTGSKIQRDGQIRMSAAIMSSADKRFSGVANIRNVKNPIQIADMLHAERHTVLAGEEATDFARQKNVRFYNPATSHRLQEYRDKLVGETGTVGAVALDSQGSITAATSTGGIGYELPGRIGDSATVAGTYATGVCGVSCTGRGEDIVNQAAASSLVTRVEDGMPLAAAISRLVTESNAYGYRLGLIALTQTGEVTIGETENMNVMYAAYDGTALDCF